jgi:hypothetical protein
MIIRYSYYYLFVILLFLSVSVKANDSLLMHQLVQRIAAMQIKEAGDFPVGMFPTYRQYDKRKSVFKHDDNIFFTGLIISTLKQIEPKLTEADRQICQQIYLNALPVYEKFRNRKGLPTYNFWQRDTMEVFPNSGWLNLMNKTHSLPEDLDDTSIILQALEAPDSVVQGVHRMMQQHRNGSTKWVKNTFKEYRRLPAYSTWFGKNMPIDFDICVLANVLNLVQQYNLPYTTADSASVQLICEVVSRRQYMTHGEYVSPHYARPAVILYHLSRLMQSGKIASLEPYRAQLQEDAQQVYQESSNFMDRVITSTTLIRLGTPIHRNTLPPFPGIQPLTEESDFVFFIANMASFLPDPFKNWIGNSGIGRFFYYCPAYNNVLVLEYLSMKN